MPSYTPDPLNVNRPQGGDRVRVAAELRGLKQRAAEITQEKLSYSIPLQKVSPTGSAGSSVTGTHTIEFSTASYRQIRIAGTCTLSVAGPNTSQLGYNDAVVFGTVRIENGGNHTVNWNPNIRWPNGVPPVLTTSGYDMLVFFQTFPGGPWHGVLAGSNFRVPD